MTANAPSTPAERWLQRNLPSASAVTKAVACSRKDPRMIEYLLEGVGAKAARIKYGSAKALWLLAEAEPRLLYPHFEFFVRLLNSEYRILTWNAARVLAAMAPVDEEGKVDRVLDRLLSPIPGPDLIPAANAIKFSSGIALAKPHLANRIARAILGVRRARYKTDECRNVAAGEAIEALGRMLPLLDDPQPAVDFVRAELSNTRLSTRAKAERFLHQRTAAATV